MTAPSSCIDSAPVAGATAGLPFGPGSTWSALLINTNTNRWSQGSQNCSFFQPSVGQEDRCSIYKWLSLEPRALCCWCGGGNVIQEPAPAPPRPPPSAPFACTPDVALEAMPPHWHLMHRDGSGWAVGYQRCDYFGMNSTALDACVRYRWQSADPNVLCCECNGGILRQLPQLPAPVQPAPVSPLPQFPPVPRSPPACLPPNPQAPGMSAAPEVGTEGGTASLGEQQGDSSSSHGGLPTVAILLLSVGGALALATLLLLALCRLRGTRRAAGSHAAPTKRAWPCSACDAVCGPPPSCHPTAEASTEASERSDTVVGHGMSTGLLTPGHSLCGSLCGNLYILFVGRPRTHATRFDAAPAVATATRIDATVVSVVGGSDPKVMQVMGQCSERASAGSEPLVHHHHHHHHHESATSCPAAGVAAARSPHAPHSSCAPQPPCAPQSPCSPHSTHAPHALDLPPLSAQCHKQQQLCKAAESAATGALYLPPAWGERHHHHSHGRRLSNMSSASALERRASTSSALERARNQSLPHLSPYLSHARQPAVPLARSRSDLGHARQPASALARSRSEDPTGRSWAVHSARRLPVPPLPRRPLTPPPPTPSSSEGASTSCRSPKQPLAPPRFAPPLGLTLLAQSIDENPRSDLSLLMTAYAVLPLSCENGTAALGGGGGAACARWSMRAREGDEDGYASSHSSLSSARSISCFHRGSRRLGASMGQLYDAGGSESLASPASSVVSSVSAIHRTRRPHRLDIMPHPSAVHCQANRPRHRTRSSSRSAALASDGGECSDTSMGSMSSITQQGRRLPPLSASLARSRSSNGCGRGRATRVRVGIGGAPAPPQQQHLPSHPPHCLRATTPLPIGAACSLPAASPCIAPLEITDEITGEHRQGGGVAPSPSALLTSLVALSRASSPTAEDASVEGERNHNHCARLSAARLNLDAHIRQEVVRLERCKSFDVARSWITAAEMEYDEPENVWWFEREERKPKVPPRQQLYVGGEGADKASGCAEERGEGGEEEGGEDSSDVDDGSDSESLSGEAHRAITGTPSSVAGSPTHDLDSPTHTDSKAGSSNHESRRSPNHNLGRPHSPPSATGGAAPASDETVHPGTNASQATPPLHTQTTPPHRLSALRTASASFLELRRAYEADP